MNNETHIVEPRAEIYRAYSVYQVTSLVLLSIWSFVFFIELWGFIEFLLKWKRSDKVKRIERQTVFFHVFLFCNSLLNMVCFSLLVVLAYSQNLETIQCEVIARSVNITYMFATQFAFLFLLNKAKLAGSFERGRTYRRLSFGAEVGVITLIPLMLTPMVLASFRGEPIFEGFCTIRGEPFAVWFFAVGGSILSIVMIYLFVKPLYSNAYMMKGQNAVASKKIIRVAKRNAAISSVAVASTLISCCAYAGLTEYANRHGKLLEHLHVLGLVQTIPWDMLVLGICCRLTTTIWMPRDLALWFAWLMAQTDSSNNSTPATNNSKSDLVRASAQQVLSLPNPLKGSSGSARSASVDTTDVQSKGFGITPKHDNAVECSGQLEV